MEKKPLLNISTIISNKQYGDIPKVSKRSELKVSTIRNVLNGITKDVEKIHSVKVAFAEYFASKEKRRLELEGNV